MCGIFGFVCKDQTGFYAAHQDLMEDFLTCGQLRGRHGTGLFRVDRNKEVDWLKIGGDANALVSDKNYSKFRTDLVQKGIALIGHNRFATRGAKGTNQAHPFQEDHITLVHNGLVTSTDVWKHKNRKVEVDSHSFAIDLANSRDNWKEKLQSTTGAFCFVWHDALTNQIHIYRNHERPLCIYETDKMFLLGSERGMVHWLGARRALTMEYKEVKPEVLYSIDLNVMDKRTIVEEELPLKKPLAPITHWNTNTTEKSHSSWGHRSLSVQPPFSLKKTVYNHGRKVGETCIFSVYEEKSIGVGSAKVWEYFCILEDNEGFEAVEVKFMSKNRHLEFLEAPLLTGEICSVHADGTIQIRARSVTEITNIPVKVMEIPNGNDEVVLKDGTKMNMTKFNTYRKYKCHSCLQEIQEWESGGCSMATDGSGMYCIDCTDFIATSIVDNKSKENSKVTSILH